MGKRVFLALFFIILCAWFLVFVAAGTTNATPVQWDDNGHWYEAISGEFTWDEAKSYAGALIHDGMTGHLATLTSLEENEFVWGMQEGLYQYFLGGERIDGDWTWVTGEDWTWSHWAGGEPNEYWGGEPPEDKLGFKKQGDGSWDGYWNDCPNMKPVTDYLGRIVGYEGFPGLIVEYEPNDPAPVPTPEPATMLLLGSGLAGLAAFRRKFRK